MYTSQDLFIPALISSFVLGIICSGFLILIVRTQRRYYASRHQAIKNELEVLWEERIRIAMDLHDDCAPLLTLASRQIEAVRDNRGDTPLLLNSVYKNLNLLSTRLRDVIHNLDDERVLQQGLENSIRIFINQYRMVSRTRFRFHYGVITNIPPDMILSLYRMLQELVQNTIKHGEADEVHVSLKQQGAMLYFTYGQKSPGSLFVDNGQGLGMKSLQHRALLMGGCLELVKEKGIHFQLQVPFR
ncbi:sensor histidine kinase [Niabella soli]|uniref:histidine kinase n=1 Tax=Niabella soli DSM 19437 TaxID=929713 RepID=W0F9N3_9BACT|nr:histidine kinase [Niabella soli]AHF18111.1 hypothetical protein NIASO_20705 [Niabella soli DSM 19437]